jgi:hypothetical protein
VNIVNQAFQSHLLKLANTPEMQKKLHLALAFVNGLPVHDHGILEVPTRRLREIDMADSPGPGDLFALLRVAQVIYHLDDLKHFFWHDAPEGLRLCKATWTHSNAVAATRWISVLISRDPR